jgi:hypothetical protein
MKSIKLRDLEVGLWGFVGSFVGSQTCLLNENFHGFLGSLYQFLLSECLNAFTCERHNVNFAKDT